MKSDIKNETNLLDAVQLLKDSLFGMTQSFAPFTFQFKKYSYRLDDDKTNEFIEELIQTALEKQFCQDNFAELMPMVFRMSIRYLVFACPPWRLVLP